MALRDQPSSAASVVQETRTASLRELQPWQSCRRFASAAVMLVLLCSHFVLGPVAAVTARADEPKPADSQQPVSFWMKKKLDYSQNILAGLANEDFDKIVKNAQAMRSLSKVEGFVRGRTPGYRGQLQAFEQATDEIIRQASKDNLDGAALGFTQMTISCVNCHKHLRETK